MICGTLGLDVIDVVVWPPSLTSGDTMRHSAKNVKGKRHLDNDGRVSACR
jgi:hypothetical protein